MGLITLRPFRQLANPAIYVAPVLGNLWVCGYANTVLSSSYNIANSHLVLTNVDNDTTWRYVSCGYVSHLAIRSDNSLWTWGRNLEGELGNGTIINSNVATMVGNTYDWATAYSGWSVMAAIKTNGTLWQWGRDFSDPLFVNNLLSSPTQVGSLNNWKSITISGNDTCLAIKTDGTLWSWGKNWSGSLGQNIPPINSFDYYSSPVQVGSLTNWKQVSTGHYSIVAAIKTDGTLWTWGQNTTGELGLGDTIKRSSPVQVGSLANWKYVSVGAKHVMAIKTDGTLWGWGNDSYGVLGTGSQDFASKFSSPIQIGSLTDWNQVESSAWSWTALKNDGTMWYCGYDNWNGTAGNTTQGIKYSSPVQIGSMTNWSFIGPSTFTTRGAITGTITLPPPSGYLMGWGMNAAGEIGNNSTVAESSPVQIGSLTTWYYIASGHHHATALKTDGTLWSWGQNTGGQLGDGTIVSKSSPIQIGSNINWKQISSGNNYSAGIATDNSLWTWGSNGYGMLGHNHRNSLSSPTQVGSLTNWKQVSCGTSCTLAVKLDGTLWSWGWNAFGQVGDNTVTSVSSPIQIGSLTNWSSVYSGDGVVFAIKTDGTLWGWGDNSSMLINGASPSKLSSPVQIGSLTNWATISVTGSFVAAIKTDGTLWTWGGDNSVGQLGLGDVVSRSSPTQVGALTNWKYLNCNWMSVNAIKTDGTLWSWGWGSVGELGVGGTLMTSSPVQVGSLNTWKYVGVGITSTVHCVL